MPLQNFVDFFPPSVKAAWLNAVDVLKFTVFNDAATKAAARTALELDTQVVINGTDTGAVNAAVVSLGSVTGWTRTVGTKVTFVGNVVNTGPTTLNVNSTGAANIINQEANPLSGGELSVAVTVRWTGSSWRIISGSIPPINARTAQETSAGIVPVNYNIPSHRATGGFVRPARYFNNTVPGTTDTTAALNSIAVFCRTNRYTIELEPETWLFSNSLDFTGITVVGPNGKAADVTFVPHLQCSSAQVNCIVSTGNSRFANFFIHGGWDGVTAGQNGNLFHFVAGTAYNIHIDNVTGMFAKRSLIKWSGSAYSSIYNFRGITAGLHGLDMDASAAICTTLTVGGYSTFSTTPNGNGITLSGDCVALSFDKVILEDTGGIVIGGANCRNLEFNEVYQENFVNPNTNFLSASGAGVLGLKITSCIGINRFIQNITGCSDVHIFGNAGIIEAAVPFAGRILEADSGVQNTSTTGGVDVTVTSISLPPGTWQLAATMQTVQNTASGMLGAACVITTNVADSGLQNGVGGGFRPGAAESRITPNGGAMDIRLNVQPFYFQNTGTVNQTIYLRGWMNFSGAGALSYQGKLSALKIQ